MTRRPIRLLPPDLSQKIAAGEVVERPASVIRELIDNAIDAGATAVKIEIREAGLKLIRVTDNGCGIPAEELPLAFQSHATNKIGDLDDLEHLVTLGFRGEALPSVAAVARVEVQTRCVEEAAGARIVVEHGEVVASGVCAAPRGLRIGVSDLFAAIPARRKFVRSLRAESSQVQSLVMLYALARTAVQFSLTIDERLTFHSPGTGSLRDAVAAVYGSQVLDRMTTVEAEGEDIAISGMISTPQLTRQNRSAISVFVNGRPVGNRSLAFALEEAYSGFLMTGHHPIAAIHLWLTPGEVDVNIHPAKREVRFARERDVHGALHRAVSNTLLSLRLESRSVLSIESVQSGDASEEAPQVLLEIDTEPVQTPLAGGLPALRVFGQTNQTFIIAEGPDGVYMIDQHAAHERILFDQLDEQFERNTAPSQPLLDPLAVELTPGQMQALEDNRDLLSRTGFALEPFGDSACLVRSIPALARMREPQELVTEVLAELETAPLPHAARERALASVACKAAVKAGQTLDVHEMRELVAQLERTPRPSTCPHGRPTMIHLSNTQLEREFGRR